MSIGSSDESSPLMRPVLRDTLGHVRPRGNGDDHIILCRCSSTTGFLFDSKHTPGLDNQRLALRHLACSWHVTKVNLLSSYVNFLLVIVPVGVVAGKLGWNPIAVFTINFFAIIPLAAVMSFATEEISLKQGETIGGLLNATFGNAVELIVSIVALLE
ncbi:hypothetical protein CDV36_015206 [Fusarium kuroshium]|uniref:Uncharacterized protein n=1 Tax=Fusarium kuroshium TaxID=2010991 RepID=A0A3M2RD79_9HYPO|nr:hypothetical protein CDV36_015206 [Fusarium kuroshium]